jgi:putative ABC transport system substrate-binding protein
MRRRDFISVLSGAAIAWPLTARAQRSNMPVIGFLRNTSADESADLVAAFNRGLNEAGYAANQNVSIEYRWSEHRIDRLPALAADLIRRRCVVIVAAGNAAAIAAKAATATIPIVFSTGDDPIELGLVSHFNQPDGNVTGIFFYTGVLQSKQLELLHEAVPNAAMIAILVNPTSPAAIHQARDAQVAARALGQQIHVLNASSEIDLGMAFANLAQLRASALVVAGNALFTGQRDRLVELATRHAVPAMYYLREFVAVGGLMSYGPSITDAYRQTGVYAGRILKGAKPVDLPVMMPTKFELVINLKVANALGLTIPEGFLLRADELIE